MTHPPSRPRRRPGPAPTPLPRPSSSIPPLWPKLDPQRQHQLAQCLAALLRRISPTCRPQEDDHAQP